MEDTTLVSNEHEEPQGLSASGIEEQEKAGGGPSKPLEIQIANRAQEIARRRDGKVSQSLASWLEAAREVLSEDSKKSHWIV